jgi:Phage Tail Collar Domain
LGLLAETEVSGVPTVSTPITGFQSVNKGASNTTAMPYVAQIQDSTTRLALQAVWNQLNYLGGQVHGPVVGTLSPDQRPTGLGAGDAGTLFWSTDYNRLFTWTGTAWTDFVGQLQRGTIAFFPNAPDNPNGWALCNGQTVNVSTSSGMTTTTQVPTLPQYTGMNPYIRL